MQGYPSEDLGGQKIMQKQETNQNRRGNRWVVSSGRRTRSGLQIEYVISGSKPTAKAFATYLDGTYRKREVSNVQK